MTLLISTAYLPPVSYLGAVLQAGSVVMEHFETYQKQTCRNHCVIYGPNGRQVLSVPVSKVNGNHTLTRDIRISGQCRWRQEHWRSIETAYNNSPFFLYYRDYLEPIYSKSHHFLVDLNLDLLQSIFQMLNTRVDVSFTSKFEIHPDGVTDCRQTAVSKHITSAFNIPYYHQVFESAHGFLSNLSVVDLIFNLGPEATPYLMNLNVFQPGSVASAPEA